jgi:N-glycosylase/DNA lyase
MIVKENIIDFNLDHIFDCGQCFRWEKQADGSYTGIAAGRQPVNIAFHPYEGQQYSGKLIIDNAEETDFDEFWSDYLDLSRDYGSIKSKLSENEPIMVKAIEFGQGMRILQQDNWETLISFIISQNNNIGRIKGCIASLCENFGEFAGEYRGRKYFRFPEASKLAALKEEDLAVCRLGYRAKYLIETAKVIEADQYEKLLSLNNADINEAFTYLTGLCGVGPKVANCIMLFSMGKRESFPVDVWVKEAMSKLYGLEKGNVKAMTGYAEKNFGEHGGIAQQYLFYYTKSLKLHTQFERRH